MSFNQGQCRATSNNLHFAVGIVIMHGDYTNSTALLLHKEYRWQRCWTAVKNLLNYTSAHYTLYQRSFRKEMKASYVMLVFVWGPGYACAAVTAQLHTSSRFLFILNILKWLSQSSDLVLSGF